MSWFTDYFTSIWNAWLSYTGIVVGIGLVIAVIYVFKDILRDFFKRYTGVFIFILGWGFFLGLTSSLLAFTLYHISVGIILGVSYFCTYQTVFFIVNSFIGISVLIILYFFSRFFN